jgi:hypothetical protein
MESIQAVVKGVATQELKVGLNVVGRAAVAGPLAPLGALLGLTQPLSLHGFIAAGDTGRQLRLTSRLPRNTGLPLLPVTLDEIALVGDLYAGDFGAGESFEISGAIQLGNRAIGIQLYAVAGGDNAILTVTEKAVLPDLSAIAGLIGAEGVLPALPVPVDKPGKLTLTQLEVQLSLSSGHVTKLSTEITAEGGWQLIDGALSIQDIILLFTIDAPFDADLRRPSVAVAGRCRLGEADLRIRAEAPSFEVYGLLDADPPLRLATFFPNSVPELLKTQDLAVRRVQLFASLNEKTFDAALTLDGSLTVGFGPATLSLHDLTMGATCSVDAVNAQLSGVLTLAGFDLRFAAAVPGASDGWMFDCFSQPGQHLPLTDLIGSLAETLQFPRLPACPDLSLNDIALSMSTTEPRLHLAARADYRQPWTITIGAAEAALFDARLALDYQGDKPQAEVGLAAQAKAVIADTETDLTVSLGAETKLEADFPEVSLSEFGKSYLPGWPEDFPAITLTRGQLRMVDDDLDLSCGIDGNFAELAQRLGVALPDGFHGFKLDRAELHLGERGASWHALMTASQRLQFPPSGPGGIQISDIQLGAGRKADRDAGTVCAYTLDGAVELLPDQIRLSFEKLRCEWNGLEGRWHMTGAVKLAFFGQTLGLALDLAGQDGAKRFTLHTTESMGIPIIGSHCLLELKQLAVFLEQSAASTRWGLNAEAAFTLDPLVDRVEAAVTLADEGEQSCLKVAVENMAACTLPHGLGVQSKIAFKYLEIAYRTAEGWSGKGETALSFVNVPPPLQTFLPADELDAIFGFDANQTFLETTALDITRELLPLRIKTGEDSAVDLGRQSLRLHRLRLIFTAKEIEITQLLDIEGLDPLNRVFGFDGDGTPHHRILKPKAAAQMVFNSRGAVNIKLLGSPFNDLELREEKADQTWWSDWNFGEFGQFSVQVPEFALQAATSSWQASGGIARSKEIRLPLAPLRLLLACGGLPKDACKAIPRSIPLTAWGNAAGLVPTLRKMLGDGAPDELLAALDKLSGAIEQAAARLPTRLLDYLTAPLPDRFQFAVDVLPAGGLQVWLKVGRAGEKDPVPLCFMLPMMLPLPEIVGFSIRGLSIGIAGGGSLATIGFDGHIDRFAILDLAAALVTPDTVLSDERAQALTNRLILEEVFAVMPVPAMVPLPIFYNQLGIDFKHFLGLDVQSYWSLPKPELGIIAVFAFVAQYIRFFTVKSYLLHEQEQPKNFALHFTVGRNYLRLPSYLGGKTLGLTKTLPDLDIYDCLARFFDGLKTGNPTYLIQAIPLRYHDTWIRIGDEELRFGPLFLRAAWCITTEQEFKEEVLGNQDAMAKLQHADIEGVLDHLPADSRRAALERGFVIFLMAAAGIDCVLKGKTQFGIAVTRDGGFETAFRWSVTLAEFIEFRFGGHILGDRHGAEAEGEVGLLCAGKNLITLGGQLEVKDTHFLIGIKIALSEHFHMEGDFKVEREQVTLSGNVTWNYGGGGIQGVDAVATFGAEGMRIGFEAKLFDAKCCIDAAIGGPAKIGRAGISLIDLGRWQQSLLDSLSTIGDEIEAELSSSTQMIEQQSEKAGELVITLDGIRIATAKTLRSEAKSLPGRVQSAVRSRIDDYVDGLGFFARKAAKPFVGGIKKAVAGKVNRELAGHIDYMNALAARLEKSTAAESKEIMIAALEDALKTYNPYVYTYRAPKPLQKLKYRYTYKMPKALVDKIHQAKSLVASLTESQRIVADKSALVEVDKRRKQLITEISQSAQAEVDEQVPQVEAIKFSTGLDRVSKSQAEVTIILRYKSEPREYKIAGDISDISSCVRTAAREFSKVF